MAKPDLYICHTAYHLLIALVRAMRAGGGQALWRSEQIPNAEALAASGKLEGVFSEVAVLRESRWPGVVTGPLGHFRNRRAYEKAGVGPKLNKNAYGNIRISNDWSVAGRYLQDCRAPHILCEDTVGGTLDTDQHLLTEQRAAADFARRPYLYWGDSPWCSLVESEDASRCTLFGPEKLVTDCKAVESEDPDKCTLFPREKLCKFSARDMLASLTAEEKAAVRRVFVSRPLPEDPAVYAEATLLLPRSFVQDGLMDQAEQDAIFKAVAAKYARGPLFIKTHPRDDTDYTALFPGATALDRTMPSEVLNFCLPGKFRRAVTVQSWVLRGFTAAEENIFLSLDEARELVSQTE